MATLHWGRSSLSTCTMRITTSTFPRETAATKLTAQGCQFLQVDSNWGLALPSEAEETYFKCSLTNDNMCQTQVLHFYGIYRVHEHGTPQTWPIDSSINSIPKISLKWGLWQEKVVPTILPTYIQDAGHLMNKLQRTFPHGLPPGRRTPFFG
jgi:hypothetical protein